MSDRMTAVDAPGCGGLMEYGRRPRAEMVAAFRAYYVAQRDEAERALATADEDLVVTTFLGPWAMKKREVVSR